MAGPCRPGGLSMSRPLLIGAAVLLAVSIICAVIAIFCAQAARAEAKRVADELEAAKTENAQILEVLALYDDALKKTVDLYEKAGQNAGIMIEDQKNAQKAHDERLHDLRGADPGWGASLLPDGVRNAFCSDNAPGPDRDYCQAPGVNADAMHGAGVL